MPWFTVSRRSASLSLGRSSAFLRGDMDLVHILAAPPMEDSGLLFIVLNLLNLCNPVQTRQHQGFRSATISFTSQDLSVTPAAIAGVMRSVWWMRAKLSYMK